MYVKSSFFLADSTAQDVRAGSWGTEHMVRFICMSVLSATGVAHCSSAGEPELQLGVVGSSTLPMIGRMRWISLGQIGTLAIATDHISATRSRIVCAFLVRVIEVTAACLL